MHGMNQVRIAEGNAATYAGLMSLSRSSGRVEGRALLSRGVNNHALRANYLSALAAVRDGALDATSTRSLLDH
jgi:transposase